MKILKIKPIAFTFEGSQYKSKRLLNIKNELTKKKMIINALDLTKKIQLIVFVILMEVKSILFEIEVNVN